MLRRISLFLAVFVAVLAVSTGTAKASEGDFNLKSSASDAQCLARSVYISGSFQIPFTCINITYPSGAYVAWAQPTDGGNPIRLGELAYGKVLFKANEPFSSLFVTLENDSRPRNPSDRLVMSGNLQQFRFDSANRDVINKPNELASDATPVPTQTPQSGGSSALRVLAIGGVLAFFALFGIVLVIFVITRR